MDPHHGTVMQALDTARGQEGDTDGGTGGHPFVNGQSSFNDEEDDGVAAESYLMSLTRNNNSNNSVTPRAQASPSEESLASSFYDDPNDTPADQSELFHDRYGRAMRIFISANVRSEIPDLPRRVMQHGGDVRQDVVPQLVKSKQVLYFGDQGERAMRTDTMTRYSYRYLLDSMREGRRKNLTDYIIHKEVDPTVIHGRKKGTRDPFIRAHDERIRAYVREQDGSLKPRNTTLKFWQEFAQLPGNSDHTAESWRTRWVKKLKKEDQATGKIEKGEKGKPFSPEEDAYIIAAMQAKPPNMANTKVFDQVVTKFGNRRNASSYRAHWAEVLCHFIDDPNKVPKTTLRQQQQQITTSGIPSSHEIGDLSAQDDAFLGAYADHSAHHQDHNPPTPHHHHPFTSFDNGSGIEPQGLEALGGFTGAQIPGGQVGSPQGNQSHDQLLDFSHDQNIDPSIEAAQRVMVKDPHRRDQRQHHQSMTPEFMYASFVEQQQQQQQQQQQHIENNNDFGPPSQSLTPPRATGHAPGPIERNETTSQNGEGPKRNIREFDGQDPRQMISNDEDDLFVSGEDGQHEDFDNHQQRLGNIPFKRSQYDDEDDNSNNNESNGSIRDSQQQQQQGMTPDTWVPQIGMDVLLDGGGIGDMEGETQNMMNTQAHIG